MAVSEDVANKFATYEDFLDSQITQEDLFYLEDEEMARKLVELGYRGSGAVLTRNEFLHRKTKQESVNATLEKEIRKNLMISDTFLFNLSLREDDNLTGKLKTLIFLRTINKKGQEISAYVDYAQRLQQENFLPYFIGKKKLYPKKTDLSYYNWDTHAVLHNSTPNFHLKNTTGRKIVFECKVDKQEIQLMSKSATNFTRQIFDSPSYLQSVIYDYLVQKECNEVIKTYNAP